jgi:hypothetical protein
MKRICCSLVVALAAICQPAFAFDISAPAVPEPMSILLVAGGTGFLIVMHKRRNKSRK